MVVSQFSSFVVEVQVLSTKLLNPKVSYRFSRFCMPSLFPCGYTPSLIFLIVVCQSPFNLSNSRVPIIISFLIIFQVLMLIHRFRNPSLSLVVVSLVSIDPRTSNCTSHELIGEYILDFNQHYCFQFFLTFALIG